MLNKDKRSIILSMVLGDGCIGTADNHYKGKTYPSGKITIKHGAKQQDYLNWKAEILSATVEKQIKVHPTKSYVKALDKSYDQFQLSWSYKPLRSWKKIFYNNNTKRIPKILKFIRHDSFAAAVWLMDDGSCTKTKKKNGTIVFTGLILYICDQFREDCEEILKWWNTTFKVNGKLKWQKQKYKGVIKEFPKIYFSNLDSLKIWEQIRPFVMQIPSMVDKFQSVENRRNRRDLAQPQAENDSFLKT